VKARWPEAELELLRDTSLLLREVAERTGRPLSSLTKKARDLGISRAFRSGSGLKRGDDNPWSDAELELLHDVSLTLPDVARLVGRPYGAVKAKASRCGVIRRPGWTGGELALLLDISVPLVEVARVTGRPLGTVYGEASLRGVVRGAQRGEQHYRWVGGPNGVDGHRGSDWPEVRLAVLERDGYSCQDCGFSSFNGFGLHVHHVIPYRLRPENDLCWLVTLCNPCHAKRPEHLWTEIPEDIALLLRPGRSGRGEQSA
jgi:hypothetical protein